MIELRQKSPINGVYLPRCWRLLRLVSTTVYASDNNNLQRQITKRYCGKFPTEQANDFFKLFLPKTIFYKKFITCG